MGLLRKKPVYKTIYKEPLTKEAKLKIIGTVFFWFAFILVMICLFILNWSKIRSTIQNALWPAWFKSRDPAPHQAPISPLPDPLYDTLFTPEPAPQTPEPLSSSDPLGTVSLGQRPALGGQEPPPLVEAPPVQRYPEAPQTAGPDGAAYEQPGGERASAPSLSPPAEPDSLSPPRDRFLYFIQVDRSGAILRERVLRRIPASNAPLKDILEVLLKGPTEEEKQRGLMSLIPEGTAILSARVLKDTVYIDVSEDFQYNIYGVEGYAAQLTQFVWTATEFTKVKDVQILIEGRRVDYLGEGIWIGSPISRAAF
jgi:hypothetical protein